MKNTIGFDAIKIQSDLMKQLYKNTYSSINHQRILSNDITINNIDYYAITITGDILYFIPSFFVFIDREYIYKNYNKCNTVDNITKTAPAPEKQNLATDTNTTILMNGKNLKIYSFGESQKIYIDANLLKPFNNDIKIYADHPLKPASIYFNNNLIAMVCPVKAPN